MLKEIHCYTSQKNEIIELAIFSLQEALINLLFNHLSIIWIPYDEFFLKIRLKDDSSSIFKTDFFNVCVYSMNTIH